AVAIDAETARRGAQMLVARSAHGALAAADPRIDEPHLADLHALGLRSYGDDLAGGLVAHGQRQRNAAVFERHALAVAEIVAAFPDGEVAVADAGRLDPQQHFGARRLRRRHFDQLQRLFELGDPIAFHVRFPPRLPSSGIGKGAQARRARALRGDHESRKGCPPATQTLVVIRAVTGTRYRP